MDNNVQTSIIEHGACRIQSIGMMLRIDILPCPRRATVVAVLFGVSSFLSTQILGCQNACAAIKLPLIQRKKNQADNKHPRLSIPSGAVGIVAGLVPSMFSEFAMRSSGGKHHERKAYPNMLCKFYDQPVIPRTDFPDSVWKHLNLCPTNSSVTRREMLLSYWEGNQNIHTLRDGVTTEKIRKITGQDQSDINIDLLNDRASMLRDLKAAVLQMTRPLMELSMCLRGQKQIADTVEIQ
ncbi:hypothetical protein KF707_19750 [Candidatus Obscuribacterales bacterium]|nr:hypothetical protein [Candidatus Obscuribacterales bacterium]MBX3149823.1 hypothetical protein [Candidatus Obscuribacterales bacterium]